MSPLRWRGHNRAGTAVTGSSNDPADVLAERFYQRGYRDVDITDDSGESVGGVGLNRVTGERNWWGESGERNTGGLIATWDADREIWVEDPV